MTEADVRLVAALANFVAVQVLPSEVVMLNFSGLLYCSPGFLRRNTDAPLYGLPSVATSPLTDTALTVPSGMVRNRIAALPPA